MNGVRFLMEDEPTEVPCLATTKLLTERFGSDGSNDEIETAFRQNREAIERAVVTSSTPTEWRHRTDTKIILSASDMASQIRGLSSACVGRAARAGAPYSM